MSSRLSRIWLPVRLGEIGCLFERGFDGDIVNTCRKDFFQIIGHDDTGQTSVIFSQHYNPRLVCLVFFAGRFFTDCAQRLCRA